MMPTLTLLEYWILLGKKEQKTSIYSLELDKFHEVLQRKVESLKECFTMLCH